MDLRTELIEFLRVNNWMSLEDEVNATGVVDVYLKNYKIDLSDNELLIHDVMHCVCGNLKYADITVEDVDGKNVPTCKKCEKPLSKHGA